MGIQSEAEILDKLTSSAKRMQQVRESAERERIGQAQFESEARTPLQTPLQTGTPLQGKT